MMTVEDYRILAIACQDIRHTAKTVDEAVELLATHLKATNRFFDRDVFLRLAFDDQSLV